MLNILILTKKKSLKCLRLNYNRNNSFLYANGVDIYQFKKKY